MWWLSGFCVSRLVAVEVLRSCGFAIPTQRFNKAWVAVSLGPGIRVESLGNLQCNAGEIYTIAHTHTHMP